MLSSFLNIFIASRVDVHVYVFLSTIYSVFFFSFYYYRKKMKNMKFKVFSASLFIPQVRFNQSNRVFFDIKHFNCLNGWMVWWSLERKYIMKNPAQPHYFFATTIVIDSFTATGDFLCIYRPRGVFKLHYKNTWWDFLTSAFIGYFLPFLLLYATFFLKKINKGCCKCGRCKIWASVKETHKEDAITNYKYNE